MYKFLLLAAIAALFISGKAVETFKKLNVYLDRVGKIKIKDLNLFVSLNLKVENPNKREVTINELSLSVSTPTKQLGTINRYNLNLPVKGLSATVIKDIQVKIGLLEFAEDLITSFRNKEYFVKGYIKVEGINLPVNEKITTT